jgi:hypothetical protein
VQLLRWLIAGLRLWKPWFSSRPVHVGFVLDNRALQPTKFRCTSLTPVNISLPVHLSIADVKVCYQFATFVNNKVISVHTVLGFTHNRLIFNGQSIAWSRANGALELLYLLRRTAKTWNAYNFSTRPLVTFYILPEGRVCLVLFL